MDAALFFLLVFIAYTVMLALSLFKQRLYSKQIGQLQHDVGEMRTVIMTQGNVIKDMSQPNLVQQGLDHAQALELLSNPLVQQAMQQSDDEQVQELQTLLSNPIVQQAMGNK